MSQTIEDILKEIPTIKAPGVSGSRIKKCTQLALENVSEESAIVSALYLQCKITPVTHKLGILYVIDAIMRAYVEDARKNGLKIDGSSESGTTAAGAYKISTYIESLIDDSLNAIDDKQKEKIGKLVDIWERSQTFDKKTIDSIRSKYFKSSTPPGTPPPSVTVSAKPPSQPAAAAVAGEIPSNVQNDPMALLQTLASMNKQQQAQNGASGPGQAPSNPNMNDPNAIFNMLKQMGQTENAEPSVASRASDPYSRRERDRSPVRSNQNYQSYRERPSHSPDSQFQQSLPQNRERNVPGTPHYREKNVSYDNSVPAGSIKVYSRTLFIGGVPPYMDEVELSAVLRPYAEVQSVILNSERRHAFVKVYSRPEAEQVISSFTQSGNTQLRTRWGVGFGPRDCCDYQHGVSIIPISRLTEADKRWIVAAEWGGTGGQPMVPGIVIDEPDIEIGSGVSSKAISKKMPTNSARNGPRSNKPGESADHVARSQTNYNNGYQQHHNNNANNPLQNLFGNDRAQAQQSPPGFPVAGAPLAQGSAPNNVNSIMQSLTQMMNQPQNGGYPSQPAYGQQAPQQQQQQQQQQGLTPELQALLAKINQPK